MIRPALVLALLIALAATAYFWLGGNIVKEGARDYKEAVFTIDGKPISLKDGQHEETSAPGEEVQWKTTTQYFGNEAKGDLNEDGVPDLAFLVTQSGGGTGTFFYAVAALQDPDGTYTGTNAVLLGDRIAPQTTEIRKGILIVNYADRKPDEPFSVQPSVGTSAYLYYFDDKLVAVPVPGPITVEGTMVCLQAWEAGTAQTAECAIGLRDNDRDFALKDSDPSYKNISGVPMGTRVRAEGNFMLQMGAKHKSIGVIEVSKITPL